MDVSVMAPSAMVVTPHHLATQTAIMILRQGGTAIEAMVAAAATIAVVYPHMNSIGGDSFWLILPPNGEPIAIDASGPAGSLADLNFFQGINKIPDKGPKSAITVAGTVAGWDAALRYLTESGYQPMPVANLLSDAIAYSEHGFPISSCQAKANEIFKTRLTNFTQDFKDIFFPDGRVLKTGDLLYQKKLANTFKDLANNGLDSFYRGTVAQSIVEDMQTLGMPITESDLFNYNAIRCRPLRLQHSHGELLNLPPPTQGVLSLSILGMLDDLHIDGKHEGEFIHAAVEATKQAFKLRDTYITDPRYMNVSAQSLLSKSNIFEMASHIDLERASPEGNGDGPGDTIWMGIMDKEGFSVSFIQSIFHEYGSGVVLPKTGILWQNRGVSFNLNPGSLRFIVPGKKPFHTLNPAAAILNDGRVMVYGTRGGDGQPQTQTAIFHRYVVQGKNLQQSVYDPRWAYGPFTMDPTSILRLENRFSQETINYLKDRGHVMAMLPAFTEMVGQAGALVRHTNGVLEGAWDVRSNGFAAGF
ncbi:oxamate amidohydrolase proenzyme-like isoform X2 [Pieris napi]|nr:oxamate amidohydrolase proenzyme-like isoform X2 [Pieris napi]XP_047503168.1 oxamate amidohydrolase proenzyme-like isoform X2 [Pieris napi]